MPWAIAKVRRRSLQPNAAAVLFRSTAGPLACGERPPDPATPWVLFGGQETPTTPSAIAKIRRRPLQPNAAAVLFRSTAGPLACGERPLIHVMPWVLFGGVETPATPSAIAGAGRRPLQPNAAAVLFRSTAGPLACGERPLIHVMPWVLFGGVETPATPSAIAGAGRRPLQPNAAAVLFRSTAGPLACGERPLIHVMPWVLFGGVETPATPLAIAGTRRRPLQPNAAAVLFRSTAGPLACGERPLIHVMPWVLFGDVETPAMPSAIAGARRRPLQPNAAAVLFRSLGSAIRGIVVGTATKERS